MGFWPYKGGRERRDQKRHLALSFATLGGLGVEGGYLGRLGFSIHFLEKEMAADYFPLPVEGAIFAEGTQSQKEGQVGLSHELVSQLIDF